MGRARHVSREMGKRPNLWIVGAPKSGTTFLYEVLRNHPQIFMSPVKEPHYFGKDLVFRRPPYPRNQNMYESLFKNASIDARWRGEASVFTLYSQSAPSEIIEYVGGDDVRIIIILRNPVDFAYSLYFEEVWSGHEVLASFEEALLAEDIRKISFPEETNLQRSLWYVENAKYFQYVQRWLYTFGRENVRVIIFEEFFNDVANNVRELFRWLDVEDELAMELKQKKINKRKIPRFYGWSKYARRSPTVVRKIWRTIPRPLRYRIYNKFVVGIFGRDPLGREKRPSAWAVKYILDRVIGDIEKLGNLLRKDLVTLWVDLYRREIDDCLSETEAQDV